LKYFQTKLVDLNESMFCGMYTCQYTDYATGWTDNRGSVSGRSNRGMFSPHHHIQTDSGAYSGAHPMGTRVQGVKLTTHFRLVPNLRVRGAIRPFSKNIFMVWCLIKHRKSFTFYLNLHILVPLQFVVSEKTSSI